MKEANGLPPLIDEMRYLLTSGSASQFVREVAAPGTVKLVGNTTKYNGISPKLSTSTVIRACRTLYVEYRADH